MPDWTRRLPGSGATAKIDTTKPHSARMYDYYLGGKDHFAADRETAEATMKNWRTVRVAVRANRAFLGRTVRYLAAEAGIRQFLDIGTGLRLVPPGVVLISDWRPDGMSPRPPAAAVNWYGGVAVKP